MLGVRDWRVYGVTLLWPPVMSGWQTANVSLLLAFGIAIAWRYRDRPVTSGVTIGIIVAIKLFLWPLLGWLVLTRRWRTLAWAVASAAVFNAISWAVLGFNEIHAYTQLVNAVTKVEEGMAYTPLALALHLGASHALADTLAGLVFAAVASVTASVSRRNREWAVLLGVLTLSLLATPIVWRHYFVLFLVPMAISRPRLSGAWWIPLLMFVCPVTDPVLWQLLLVLGVVSLLVVVLFRWPERMSLRGSGTTRLVRGARLGAARSAPAQT